MASEVFLTYGSVVKVVVVGFSFGNDRSCVDWSDVG